MKPILTLFLYLCSFGIATAQTDIMLDELEQILTERTKNSTDNAFVIQFFKEYREAENVTSSDLDKDYVGICLESPSNEGSMMLPAKYTIEYKNNELHTNLVTPRDDGNNLTQEQQNYIRTFLYDSDKMIDDSYLISLKYVTSDENGILENVDDEFMLIQNDFISLIRTRDTSLYMISFEEKALFDSNFSTSTIKLYSFNKEVLTGDDYIMIYMEKERIKQNQKHQEMRKEYPLFHDYRTDELRSASQLLIQDEPYKSEETLVAYTKAIQNTKLDRVGVRDYVKELIYFANLKIDKEYTYNHFFSGSGDIANINHLATHALADIYFGDKDYPLAEMYYKKALLEAPLLTSSGTTFEKDAVRIVHDLAVSCYNNGNLDESYAYLLTLLNSDAYNDTADDLLLEYWAKNPENKKRFKKDIDKALKTFKTQENEYSYWTFRNKKVFFYQLFFNKNSFAETVTNSTFYQSLSE